MDLNGPNANIHYRGINHQHDEVRLIDYARLCEHLSSRKIILLQLFRAIFRRLNQRCLPLKEEDTTRSTPPEFVYTEDVLLPSLVLFLTRNFEWELPNLIQHLAKVYPDNDFITEYSQSIAKLAKATLVDIIDLFHDLSKFIQKRGESNFANENQLGHQSDKLHYTIKGWSLVGKINFVITKQKNKEFHQLYKYRVDAKNALNDGMSMSLLRSEKDIMPLCVDQLISSTLNTSQKVDNLLLLDNRYLKQLDNSSAGFLTTDDCVCVESWPSVQLMSRGNLPAVLQRIDTDFERTDVKSRFNWINRAAVHYLNKTAFWNLAQYNDFVLLYSAMVLDNSEHLHLRHTDYYALACSYLSMAILNQGQYNLASQMLNKSIDLVQLSTNAHNLIDMARADVQFVLQCRRSEWDRALVTAKTFSNYSQIEYEIRRAICLHNLNELDDSQRDPIELQKLLNQEKVSDLISRIKLLLLLTENCAKKNDLVPSLGFLEECKQLCIKYNLQHYLILCLLYEVQLNKSNFTTSQESIRILTFCLTELLKYGDRYNVARCALLLGRLYLLEMAEDRVYPNYSSDAEHLLLLAKDIFTSFQETLHLKLTYLYLVFTYHDSIQVEKRKQMAKLYKQIDVKLDNKPTVI
ncbi:unnamed protein product [Rotaria magnacalcarata]|uniref:Anaphase-promoting complex subunit 5 n=1 Tax=Rotaria magnacalcarata TaxID=392030 RepID=A0A8S2M689_9BILA|nr:unnamed protein product [Rotaria magnacalcarata]